MYDTIKSLREGLRILSYWHWVTLFRFPQKNMLWLASKTARELNPLALRAGLATWPMFGKLDDLTLTWQDGTEMTAVSTAPAHPAVGDTGPAIISPLLVNFGQVTSRFFTARIFTR